MQVQIATALKPTEVSPIAERITVRIDGAGTGSGVIIERQGNTYTILTNWHVVQEEGSYTVYTSDGKQYTFKHSQARQLSKDVDLAVFQFTSKENYPVVEKGNFEDLPLGTTIHVAGFPQGSSSISFLSGQISSRVQNPEDGYAFIYTVNAFPDMSGGPILDEQGKLVGIHGRSLYREDTNATTVYGIPLKTYLSLVPFAKPVATTPSPKPQNTSVYSTKPVNLSFLDQLDFTLKPVAPTPSPKPQNTSVYSTKPVDLSFLYQLDFTLKPVAPTLSPKPQKTPVSSAKPPAITSPSVNKPIKLTLNLFILVKTLTGHSRRVIKNFFGSGSYLEGIVQSVAISPDSRTLASGSWDNTIKIWNLTTGQQIRTFKGHSSSVTSVAFSPDGRTLASGSWDKTIQIWNLTTGQQIRTLKGHSDSVNSVAISPDGKTLVSSSKSQIITWNFANGKKIRALKDYSGIGRAIEFFRSSFGPFSTSISPDNKTLAIIGNSDNSIEILNLATGQQIHTLKDHSGSVNSVAFSPDGRTLASGGADGAIKIWDVATGQESLLNRLTGHSGSVNSVAFSREGKTLVSGSGDTTIKIWRLSEVSF